MGMNGGGCKALRRKFVSRADHSGHMAVLHCKLTHESTCVDEDQHVPHQLVLRRPGPAEGGGSSGPPGGMMLFPLVKIFAIALTLPDHDLK